MEREKILTEIPEHDDESIMKKPILIFVASLFAVHYHIRKISNFILFSSEIEIKFTKIIFKLSHYILNTFLVFYFL